MRGLQAHFAAVGVEDDRFDYAPVLRFEGAVKVQRLGFRSEGGGVSDLQDRVRRQLAFVLFGDEDIWPACWVEPLAGLVIGLEHVLEAKRFPEGGGCAIVASFDVVTQKAFGRDRCDPFFGSVVRLLGRMRPIIAQ